MAHFYRKKGVLVAGILFFLSSFASAAPLKVLSAVPRGATSVSDRQAVTVTFNQPVTSLSETTQFSSQDCPISITPHVAGSCRYVGTQTLQFEPSENWPLATQFTLQIKKGFASRVSGQKLASSYTFSFSTQTPQVRRVLPRNDEHWISLTPSLYAQFNLPVTPENIVRFVTLQDDTGKTVALHARALTDLEWEKDFSYTPKEQQVALMPAETLTSGKRYTLTFKQGLKATVGTLGMQKPFTTHFFTYPPLAVQGIYRSGCLPFTPGIRFSSPVRLRELMRGITVSTQQTLPELADQELDSLGREVVIYKGENLSSWERKNYQANYALTDEEINQGAAFFFMPLSFLKLPPLEPVKVTISKEVSDIYGNTLGQDYTFEITNSGYCPSAEFSGGFGVLESYLKARLPIELMNIASLPVRAASFNKENFIPFDQQHTRYCQTTALENLTYEGDYSFPDVKNKTLSAFLDLLQFKPTEKNSIIFSQILLPRRNQEENCWVSSVSNLTDVGVTFKTSAQSILVWTTSLKDGTPLPAMQVELRDADNKVLWTGITDEKGLAFAPGWQQLDTPKPDWGQPKLYVFVSSPGGDAVLNTELNEGMELWRFNVPFSYNAQRENLRTQLFTERGIYRPGETIYVKGISRQMTPKGWAFPSGLKGELKLTDNRGEQIASQEVVVSALGSFNTTFAIPQTAHTGAWELSFTPQMPGLKDPMSTYLTLRVEAVKQADFEVNLHPQKTSYLSGALAQFSMAAAYNFGAPLTNAPVKWSLQREMAWFQPKGYDEYVFTPYFLRKGEYKENGKQIASASGSTDDKGTASFQTTLPEVTTPMDVFAEVGVQSPAKQDLFARTKLTVHPGNFYLGTKILTENAQENKPVQVEVIALTPDGKRVAAHVVAQIRKMEWYSVRKVGLSGRLEWVSEEQEIELPSQTFDITEREGTFSFLPSEGGNYQVTLSAQDGAGHTILGGFDVYVRGKDSTYWSQRDDDLLVIKQDKNTYKPGQKARISVQSPYEQAVALVTVEREGILDAWITNVKQGKEIIEVPIKENYMPNVYVGVTLVRGRSAEPVKDHHLDLGKPQGKTGYALLTVAPEQKKMDVKLKTDRAQYRPGQEVTVKLQTKSKGKSGPAEVTVMVVDEGVLALTDYQLPDLFKAFYQELPLSVSTADNRAYVIGQRNFGEKGENRGGGGNSLFKLGGADLRSHFSFVPYFNATVVTNSSGKGEVRFKLPDNLTKFRIMAVAAREAEFGSSQTFIQVSKPLMIQANLPRLARVGDEFDCRAIVYNYGDKKGELTVSAQATGAVELTEDTKLLQVPLGQAKDATWKCKALQTGEAKLAFHVQGKGKETDGMIAKLSVENIEKAQTLLAYGATQNSREELLDKPGSVREAAANQVTLSLASTALLQVKGALNYLISYPFDCLEQQLSKSLPVISSEALMEAFSLGDVAALKEKAQSVLDHLEWYQTASGGFNYWKNSFRADPFVTSYALEVAYVAKQQGYRVPQKVLQTAADWLAQSFNKTTQWSYPYSAQEIDTSRAYAAYVLALYGKNTDALFNNLYTARTSLPVPALAYLLKEAYVSGRDAKVQAALATQLLNHSVHTPTSVYFTSGGKMPWLHSDEVTATALALDALLVTKQPFEQAYQVVSWLLEQLSAQGYWDSTQSNALAFQALNRYYTQYESAVPDFTAHVTQNDKIWQTATFKGRTLQLHQQTVSFQDVYAEGTEARLTFEKQGTGTLYYTLGQVYVPQAYNRPVSAGFEVSRALTDMDGNPVAQVQSGHQYKITLTVRTAQPQHFVVLEDFVPAGLEIVNTRLANQSRALQRNLWQANEDSYFFYTEKYDGSLAAFADYLPAGTHTYTYAVSAVASGTFAWPSAWASQMYDPAVFGRNTTSSLTIVQ